jgi:Xaa-Pro aminopeptidase
VTQTLDLPMREYEDRRERLSRAMLKSGLDGLLVTSQYNHRYLTGHWSRRWIFSTTPIASIYAPNEEAIIICDKFEEAQVAATSWVTQVRSYPMPLTRIDPYTNLIRDGLLTLGLEHGRIGAELGTMQRLGMPFLDFDRLRSSMPTAVFIDASSLLWELRLIKSDNELEVMRRAISLTDAARECVYAGFKEGQTEFELTQLLYAELATLGSEPGGYVIAKHLDASSAQPERPFQPGDVLYIDAGGIFRGYVADCCRSVAVNRLNDGRREGFRMLWEVQQEALGAVKAGVSVEEVIDAYRTLLRRLQEKHAEIRLGSLPGFIGHGIGMEVCEPPNLIEPEKEVILEEGMALMIEPSFGWREDWYINEEPVVVTSTGYTLLGAPAPREIRII